MRVTQQLRNILGGFQDRHSKRYDAVISMAQGRAKKPQVAGKKRWLFRRVQEPQNFLLIIPLGPADFKADLLKVDAATV